MTSVTIAYKGIFQSNQPQTIIQRGSQLPLRSCSFQTDEGWWIFPDMTSLEYAHEGD
jgi:hypothetical protein